MNGGRLSDDETFCLGVDELRAQLRAPAADAAATQRALARIGMRYPEAAEELEAAWPHREEAAALLDTWTARHAEESAE
jgi:hypothetical protein